MKLKCQNNLEKEKTMLEDLHDLISEHDQNYSNQEIVVTDKKTDISVEQNRIQK